MKVRKNKKKKHCYWLRTKTYPEQCNDDVIAVTEYRCRKTGDFCDNKEDPNNCPVKNLKKRGK